MPPMHRYWRCHASCYNKVLTREKLRKLYPWARLNCNQGAPLPTLGASRQPPSLSSCISMYWELRDFKLNFGTDGIFAMDRMRGGDAFFGEALLNE